MHEGSHALRAVAAIYGPIGNLGTGGKGTVASDVALAEADVEEAVASLILGAATKGRVARALPTPIQLYFYNEPPTTDR